jgi:hypothetical protein
VVHAEAHHEVGDHRVLGLLRRGDEVEGLAGFLLEGHYLLRVVPPQLPRGVGVIVAAGELHEATSVEAVAVAGPGVAEALADARRVAVASLEVAGASVLVNRPEGVGGFMLDGGEGIGYATDGDGDGHDAGERIVA